MDEQQKSNTTETVESVTHSPGPWIVEEIDEKSKDDLYIDSPVAFWIAQDSYAGEVVAVVESGNRELGVANARLVACAPELLAALKGVVEVYDVRLSPAIQTAKAAIAKAEGRS